MESPLVSVLLASYNHAPFVEAAVRSVMAQKGVSFELLVIDDGSTDSSPEILQRLSEEFGFKYRHRENKGLVKTLNELLAEARGKYFCTFASDDVMAPGRLKLQSDFLEQHPEAPACAAQVIEMDASGETAPALDSRFLRTNEATFGDILLGNVELCGATEMIVKSKMAAIGNYDERFGFEDFPAWLALSKKFGKIPILPDVVCYYRIHSASMHNRYDFMYSQILQIVELYRSEPAYIRAKNAWKTRWFSSLAYADKWKALCKLPKLASLSRNFWLHFPKLFVPQKFLKH